MQLHNNNLILTIPLPSALLTFTITFTNFTKHITKNIYHHLAFFSTTATAMFITTLETKPAFIQQLPFWSAYFLFLVFTGIASHVFSSAWRKKERKRLAGKRREMMREVWRNLMASEIEMRKKEEYKRWMNWERESASGRREVGGWRRMG